uniref:Uncharacterized protein n=1 Tax=Anopheles quadriannulatus TaxID=34691 RepID=A0A182XTJ1_ANOQN
MSTFLHVLSSGVLLLLPLCCRKRF